MYPEPRQRLFPRQKRLSVRRKAVTICAACINTGDIITVEDTKLTFFGGAISAEGVASKSRQIHKDWRVLIAGDVSPLTPLLDAVKEAVKNPKQTGLRHFARACAQAYRVERERIIEDDILPDYDLSTYAEYLALKGSDPRLFEAIGSNIKEAEEKWQLLFCGFTEDRKPHLFVISGRGKIEYCDAQGFAAIGSGAWAAFVALASYPYHYLLDREEATYCLLAAKFASESAEGVGEETQLSVMKRGHLYSSFLLDGTINSVRRKWKKLPRIPKSAAAEIKKELEKWESRMAKAR